MIFTNALSYVAIVIICIVVGLISNPPDPLVKKDLLRSYISGLSSVEVKTNGGVTLGMNVNLDFVVDALELFDALNIQHVNQTNEEDHVTPENSLSNHIDTKEDLSNIFSHFFSTSSAGERIVTNTGLWTEILQAAEKLEHTLQLGGNSALMASQFRKEGISNVVVSGSIGPKLHQLLQREKIFIADEILGGDVSKTGKDETHLILEYKTGDEWGDDVATRSNRFIISQDILTSKLYGLETLGFSLSNTDPNLIVISGLHLLEVFPLKVAIQRLEAVRELLSHEPPRTTIHLELASMSKQEYVIAIANILFGTIDSIGLNEGELVTLYEALISESESTNVHVNRYDTTAISSGEKLDIAVVADVLSYIFHWIDAGNSRNLSRIHFHSYSHHIVALQKGQGDRHWAHPRESVLAGSVTATLHACDVSNENELHGNDLTLKGAMSYSVNGTKIDISLDNNVGVWNYTRAQGHLSDVTFYATNLVACKHPKRTVGLGDAISASALAREI